MARLLMGLSLLALLALAALLAGPPPAEPGLGLAAVRGLAEGAGAHDAHGAAHDPHASEGSGHGDGDHGDSGHGAAHDPHASSDADGHADGGNGDGDKGHGDHCDLHNGGGGHGDGDTDVSTTDSSHADGRHLSGGHGDGHEVDPTSCAVMFVFFGSLVMGGALHSFMHWGDPDIRMAAHQMLSVSVSVFCAMTIFKAIEGLVFKQIIAGDPPLGLGIKDIDTMHGIHLFVDFVIFVCLVASISWCCRCTYQHQQELVTWFNVAKSIVPHLAGFCGFILSDTFLDVMIHVFKDEYSHQFIFGMSITGLVILIRLLCWAMHCLRQRPWFQRNTVVESDAEGGPDSPGAAPQSSEKRHHDSLHGCTEAIEEGEDDVTAFVLSGAIYANIHYLILNYHGVGCPEYGVCFHLVPGKLPDTCEHEAVVRAWITYSWPAVVALIVTTCPCWGSTGDLLKRVFRFLSVCSGLLCCRLVLGMVVHWFFWHYTDSEVAVYMGVALFNTTFAIALTFLFDFLADVLESKGVQMPKLINKGTTGDTASDSEAQQPLSSTTPVSAPRSRFSALKPSGLSSLAKRNRFKSRRTGVATTDDIGQYVATSTRGLIIVLGLLVGLSWEAVFEKGEHIMVEFVHERMTERGWSSEEKPSVVIELVLSIAVLLCVVPVWAKHLVPAAEMDRAYHKTCIEEEKAKDMFTLSVLSKLWLSCCPCWKRLPFCKP